MLVKAGAWGEALPPGGVAFPMQVQNVAAFLPISLAAVTIALSPVLFRRLAAKPALPPVAAALPMPAPVPQHAVGGAPRRPGGRSVHAAVRVDHL